MRTVYLDPKMDFIFKKLMEDEELLLNFLRVALKNSEGELISAKIVNPITKKEFIKDKHSILDVRVVTADGREINIEIQNRDEKNMTKRTLYHWSKMYGEQIVQGDNYKQLRKTICINILNFEYLEHEKGFHNVYRLLNSSSSNELKDSTLEIHFIELPKYDKYKEFSDNEGLKAWVEFLNHPERTLTLENSVIKKAVKKLEVISSDEETIELFKLRQQSLLEGKLAVNTAKADGIEEVAINLIKKGMDDGFIQEVTLLNDYEIRALRNQME